MTYRVVLLKCGPNVVQVIYIIRKETLISLHEAKNLIDNTPQIIKSQLSYEIAMKIKNDLESYQAEALVEDDGLEETYNMTTINDTAEQSKYSVILDQPNYSRLPEIIFLVDGKVNPDGFEIRDFVECIPYTVRYNLTLSVAEEFAKKLKALGCKVRVIQEA